MIPINDFLARLRNVRQAGEGEWSACCPAHDDENPSLSITYPGRNGGIVLKCHAGCSAEQICVAVGVAMKDLFPESAGNRPGNKGKGQIVAQYTYRMKDGAPLIRVVRFEPKDFRRKTPDGAGGWRWGGSCGIAALYRWPELAEACAAARRVYLVEGEKDADNLAKAGADVTTCLGGASKWVKSLAKEFAGAASVVILADNDVPGRNFARRARRDIAAEDVPVRALTLPEEIHGKKVKDISDALAAGWTLADVEGYCETAAEISPGEEIAAGDDPKRAKPSAANGGAASGSTGESGGASGSTGESGGGLTRDDESEQWAAAARDAVRRGAGLRETILSASDVVTAKYAGSRIPAEKQRAAISVAGREWLFAHGQFYSDADKPGEAGAMYFYRDKKRLYGIADDGGEFACWLSREANLPRTGNAYKELISDCRADAVSFWHGKSQSVKLSLFWDMRGDAVYISNGEGTACKITSGRCEIVDNGADGVLFRRGRTLAPWELLPRGEAISPLECDLFKSMATERKHGALLMLLWLLALPFAVKERPPLVFCGGVGSGKTRAAIGLLELLGISTDRCATADKDKEEDFWVSANFGGVLVFDNVDTKIKWLPDALAKATTGLGIEARKKYSDDELTSLRANSAFIVTTSNPTFAADPGLSDRLETIWLARRNRDTKGEEFTRDISSKRNACLSFIAWAIADALGWGSENEKVPAMMNSRHPDWAAWAWKCGAVIGEADEAEAALREGEADKGLMNLIGETKFGEPFYRIMCRRGAEWSGDSAGLRKLLIEEKVYESDESARWGSEAPSTKTIGRIIDHAWTHFEKLFLATRKRGRNGWIYTFNPPVIIAPETVADDTTGEIAGSGEGTGAPVSLDDLPQEKPAEFAYDKA